MTILVRLLAVYATGPKRSTSLLNEKKQKNESLQSSVFRFESLLVTRIFWIPSLMNQKILTASVTHTQPLPPPRSSASDVTLATPPTQTQFFAFISFLPSFRAYFTSLLDTQNCRALALRQEEEKKWSAGNKSERALDPITLHQTHLKHLRYVCALY